MLKKNIQIRFHLMDSKSDNNGIWIWSNNIPGIFVPLNIISDNINYYTAITEPLKFSAGDSIAWIIVGNNNGYPNWSNKSSIEYNHKLKPEYLNKNILDIYFLSSSDNPSVLFKKPKMISFHYKRETEDYDGWMLHAFGDQGVGADFLFSRDLTNPGYYKCNVPAELVIDSTSKLMFKLHKDAWKETDGNSYRIIDITYLESKQLNTVYIRQHHHKIYFSKPEIFSTNISLHYYKYDDDFDGLKLCYCIDGGNNHTRCISGFGRNTSEWPFQTVKFKIDFDESQRELCLLLGDSVKYDPVGQRRIPLKKGEMNLYIVENIDRIVTAKFDALELLRPRVLKAVFDNSVSTDQNIHNIWVELNRPIPESILTDTSHFQVIGPDGTGPKVINVLYTDNTKRRLRIDLEKNSIGTLETKYNLVLFENHIDKHYRFYDPIRISIQRLYHSQKFIDKFIIENKATEARLGCKHCAKETSFKFWSPHADSVNLLIYENENEVLPSKKYSMNSHNGLWFLSILAYDSAKLKNKFYTYELFVNGTSIEITDPYAVSCGINATRAAIVDLAETNPNGWKNHKRPQGKATNPVIYEMSIRDFTEAVSSNVSSEHRGKFCGVIEKLDHLKYLGVDVIQLLPVTKFASDETRDDFGGYNWGYDQLGLWFLPEGIYCTDPHDPIKRIKEFKEMVKACHENGIRVVIDAVHNHTYETENSVLNQSVPGYYYRTLWDDSFSNGSGCGNETKSENIMMGKLIRDYLKYWVDEMCVDGFRFDLMSLTDKYTMEQIRSDIDAINPNVLIYGEAYYMGWSILSHEMQASKENMNHKELNGIGAFTDIGSRNAIRGYNFTHGLATGAPFDSYAIEAYSVGQKGEFIDHSSRGNDTYKVVNYIDVHDDLLLYDFLTQFKKQMSETEIVKRYKLAYSMLFNYIGPILIKSGVECLFTKHGDFNSYRSENVNIINWDLMESNRDILEYFKEYIHFRKSHPAYVMSRKDVYSKFVVTDSHNGCIRGKMFVNNANHDPCKKLLVYHNISTSDLLVDLPDEPSGWAVLANENTAGSKRIGEVLRSNVLVPALTTLILGDNESVNKL